MAHKDRNILKERRKRRMARTRREIREHPVLFFTYVVLRAAVVVILVMQIFNRSYYNVFLCLLTLLLFMIPTFVERRLHIDVPNTLEIIILLFIFSANILGEIQEYYLLFPSWDTMLHTINGFLMAAIGLALIDILNNADRIKMQLSPVFVVLTAFCFSMTVGVLWEFFEYGMDCFFGMDMQKDTWITTISSVSLNPDGKNLPVQVAVEEVSVNGELWPAYLDVGLHDTMKDLLVNFVGAVVFSVIGLFYLKGRGRLAKQFLPRRLKEASHRTEEEEPEEKSGGEKEKD